MVGCPAWPGLAGADLGICVLGGRAAAGPHGPCRVLAGAAGGADPRRNQGAGERRVRQREVKNLCDNATGAECGLIMENLDGFYWHS